MRSTIKRITALMLAVSIFLLMPVYAAENSYENDDNFVYFEILNKLEIMPKFISDKNPDEAITKGEFSYLVAAGFGYSVSSAERYFEDIDYSKDYAGAVMSLYQSGIVKGASDKMFNPEKVVTTAEAATMIMRALGYEPMAEEAGGYPSGYLAAASKAGIFNGVSQADNNLTISAAVRLVFNSLTVDRMERKSYSEEATYVIKDDSSELYNRYGLKYAEGVVEKNNVTSLDSKEGTNSAYVVIDGEEYSDIGYMAQNLLGYHADVLYEEDNGKRTIFLIYASDDNNTIKIDSDDVYDIKNDYLLYGVDNKEKKAKVEFNAAIIYNGVSAPTINAMEFVPDYGDVLLVDNNGDGVYDVVFVNSYENYVVNLATEDAIVDINNEIIDLSDYDEENVFIIRNGQQEEISDLAPYDVISVCRSIDDEMITIYVASEQITGIFESASDDEYVIGEKAYTISPELAENISEGAVPKPELGEELVAYLDIKGNIAHFKEALFNGMKYGYVMGLNEGRAGFEDTMLRVINHLGEVEDLILEDAVLVNQGSKYEIENLLPLLKDGTSVKHQLVKYKTKGKGELEEISFEETGDIADEKRLVLSADYTGAKKYWRPSGRCFDGLSPVTADTVFFSVPTDNADKKNADKYAVANCTILQNDQPYEFKAYDAGEAGVVSVILLEGGKTSSFDPESTICVISDVSTSLNEKEEVVLSISYMLAGTMKSALTESEVTYGPTPRVSETVSWLGTPDVEASSLIGTEDGIGDGDVVFFNFNSEGKIDGIYKIADASKAPDMYDGLTNPTALSYKAFQLTYGKMLAINNTIYTILPEGKTDESLAVPFSSHYTGTRYTYVDLNERNVTPVKVTVDYLNRCSNNDDYRVLTRSGNAAVLDCVIYKLKK